MKSEKENELNSADISRNNSLSIYLIDNYETPQEKIKFPFKKYNYKSLLYRKRIKYGHLSKIGIVNEKLRFLPTLDISEDLEENKISNLIKIPHDTKIEHGEENYPEDLENSFYLQKLFYNSDLNLHFRKSQREIKLRKMLGEKIKELSKIIKK